MKFNIDNEINSKMEVDDIDVKSILEKDLNSKFLDNASITRLRVMYNPVFSRLFPTKKVLFDTQEGWNAKRSLISDDGTLYVYVNHWKNKKGQDIAGVKINDTDIYIDDHLYLKDRTGTSSNDDYNYIAGSYYNGAINNYYNAEGYHAFYTNSTGEGTGDNVFYIQSTGIRFVETSTINVASNTFKISNHASETTTSLASKTIKEGTISCSTTGNYYPIAISGWTGLNRYLVVNNLYFTARGVNTATVHYGITNWDSSAHNASVTVYIAWVKC